MTEKLPVGDALNETFQFALHRWGSILRFGWAPMAIAALMFAGLIRFVAAPDFAEKFSADPMFLYDVEAWLQVSPGAAFLAFLAVFIVVTALWSGFLATLVRLTALGEERPGFIHLRFDGPAMRVFAGCWIVIGIYVVVTVGLSIFQALFMTSGLNVVAQLIGMFSIAVMFFLGVRLSLVTAFCAAEDRIAVMEAVRLTNGNFWTLLGFFAILTMCLVIAAIIVKIVTAIVGMLGMIGPIGGIFTFAAFIISFAFQLFSFAIQFSAIGILYRRLKTGA